MNDGASERSECANCGAPLAGPFCSACGQKAAPLNPRARDFVEDLSHELLDVDGRIYRSVWFLLARPGFLTRELFAGRRARYVSPIRLYLLFSVLFFAVVALSPNLLHLNITYTPSPGEIPLAPEVVEQHKQQALVAINEVTNTRIPRVMFVLVPLFAALVMVTRIGSGRNYPQHLYFALHVHSVWFFVGAVAGLTTAFGVIPYASVTVRTIGWIYGLVYVVTAFRRAYDTTVFGALWRSLVATVSYLFVVAVTVGAIWLWVSFRAFAQAG